MYECLGLDHACLLMDHHGLQMELGIEDDSFWFWKVAGALHSPNGMTQNQK